MKRLISLLTALTLLISSLLLPACSGKEGKNGPGANTTEPSDRDSLVIAAAGASAFTIVCPDSESVTTKGFASNVQALLLELTGVEIPLTNGSDGVGTSEILIGNTDRPQSARAAEMLNGHDYIVAAIDGKLVIFAESVNDYVTALGYLRSLLAKDERLTVPADLCYTGDRTAVFVADEKVDGPTRIDITLSPYSNRVRAGLFVGTQSSADEFGYRGYCLIAGQDTVTLYQMRGKMTALAEHPISGLRADKESRLRLEIEGNVIRGYYLDDAEGVEPWPEIELRISDCEGYSAGYVELSGYGAKYRDFTVSSFDSVNRESYTNAVYDDYADPDVLFYDGSYYLYATGGSGYEVHTSTDLVNWKMRRQVVSPDLWGITKNYWAPDLEYIGGKFYMVVSCDEHLGIAVGTNPLGPFKAMGDAPLYEKSIDGHLFVDDDGQIYLYFVSWRGAYGIYGVRLDENMRPVPGTEKQVIRPTESWEKQMGDVTEGPYMLKHNGIYYLTYSGSHYESPDYAVGYATSDQPLGNFKKYAQNPIMKGNTQIHGTGHHCITTTPDGKDMLIVYHCHNSLTAVQVRKICVDRIRFAPVEGGIDRLEVYGPTVTPQPMPCS